MKRRHFLPVLAAPLVATTGCFRKIEDINALPMVQSLATLPELLERLEAYGGVSTLRMTADIQLSVVSDDGRKRKTYNRTRSRIIAHVPGRIRMQAILRGLGTTIFDMAADAEGYRVSIPPKNKFYLGGGADAELAGLEEEAIEFVSMGESTGDQTEEEIAGSPRLQKLDPRDVLDALIVKPYDPQREYPVLDSYASGTERYQVVQFLVRHNMGFRIARKAYFHRGNLELARVELFDEHTQVVANSYYAGWDRSGSIPYPKAIDLNRPIDGYGLSLDVRDPGINQPVPDDGFVLTPPKGAEIKRIGSPEANGERAEARP